MKTCIVLASLCANLLLFYVKETSSYLECGNETYYTLSERMWTCCGGKLQFKTRKFSQCCGNVAYNPAAQICCGGRRFMKYDVNTGCCKGKYYRRGEKQCCGKTLIDNKSGEESCCRNVPYLEKYAGCCEGELVSRLMARATRNFTCCGPLLHNPVTEICCSGIVARKHHPSHTKCCIAESYDARTSDCCKGNIIPKQAGKDKCCHGDMYNSKSHICCDYRIQEKPFTKTGCCRLDTWKYGLYNEDQQICCSRKINNLIAGNYTSCCFQTAYDVRTHICCDFQLYKRRPGLNERCCDGIPFNRDDNICCEETLYPLIEDSKEDTLCCGTERYDRRYHTCIKKKLHSLDFSENVHKT